VLVVVDVVLGSLHIYVSHGIISPSTAVTLLNLSGESPLSQYSGAGKVATGVLGLFATGYVIYVICMDLAC
jgi:bifunctional ADP-heptose synthase (sugar kinase/adenylyltransferase)